ncbi:MAG: GGDEF domain-containing protein [Lachnospiraceae bacterium]|nr:GGDEF domain-containing protein [Lachnospiraceae bacterium]
MENNQQKMMNILFSNKKNMFFYWNCVKDFWQVFGDYISKMNSEKSNPLKALMEEELILPEDRNVFQAYLFQIEKGLEAGIPESSLEIQCHIKSREGYQWYSINCRFLKDEQNRIIEIAGFLEPMSAVEIMQKKQQVLLTMDRTPQVLAKAVREQFSKYPQEKFAFIQLDVERFKMINELYGDAFGTEVLGNILSTLKGICSKEQLYTRLSADLFLVVTRYKEEKELVEFIHYMEENLNHYKDVSYAIAFGVYLVSDKTMEIRHMADSAALARKSIKGNALQNIAFYSEDMKSVLYSRKFIEDNMKTALKEGQFVMYLQPKYSISENRIIGAEALVRWIHPEMGMIVPMNFIPVLEENGFIVKLDEYIWEQACATIRKWMDAKKVPVPISVNVSRVDLMSDKLLSILNELLEKYQIPKELLELEITETVQNINIGSAIRSLKEEGYTLLMDDFGSGASSLNTLKNTPFDVIKIDREFLNDFIESDRGQKIIAHTIHMTKDIGLDLIAEGVETKEQAMFLQDCGCNMAQGYYYAKPMALEEFNQLIL